MNERIYLCILVMAAVSYAVRALPLTLLQKPLRNRFLRSFLYYVPCVTLAVMTVPAMVTATESPWAGALALLCGVIAAWYGAGLLQVAVISCATVFLVEWLLPYLMV